MAIISITNDILIDFDGVLNYLTPDALYVKDTNDPTITPAMIFSGDSDLGEPSVDKLLNFIDIDYIGSLVFTFALDGVVQTSTVMPNKASRGTAWVDLPLSNRKPFQKLRYMISGPTPGTEIYNVEIDFSILNRRRYN